MPEALRLNVRAQIFDSAVPTTFEPPHAQRSAPPLFHVVTRNYGAELSKLKLYLAETFIDLGEEPVLLQQIFCHEGDAEAQVMAGIIPGNGRDQLLRD